MATIWKRHTRAISAPQGVVVVPHDTEAPAPPTGVIITEATMWAWIENNIVREVWSSKPDLHPTIMANVSEKTLGELAALGWNPPPPPPPPPTPMEELEVDMNQSKVLFAMLNRERTQRSMTKQQLLDELKMYLP